MSVVDLAAMARAVGDAADDHAGDCPSDSCAACCAAAEALVQLRALREACARLAELTPTVDAGLAAMTWLRVAAAIRRLGEPPKESR